MSYDTLEESTEDGSPVELLEFRLNGDLFAFTTGAEPIVHDGNTYTPVSADRDSLTVSNEERGQVITVSMPASETFVRKYIGVVPGQKATLSILRLHRFDGLDPETNLLFKGIVRAVSFTTQGLMAQVAVMPLTGALSRQVPKFTYQSLCNHILYDPRCKADPNLFKYTQTVTLVSGVNLTVFNVGTLGVNWAAGGYVKFGDDYRLVIKQTGNVLKLLLPFYVDPSGETVDVFAGCDHSTTACVNKFANLINFGGFPYVPSKNVFVTGLN